MTAPFRKKLPPGRCARCDAPIEPQSAFLTADGAICDACHHTGKLREKSAHEAAALGTDVLLYGLLALGAGLAIVLASLLQPDGVITGGHLRVGGGAVAIAFTGCLQAFRLPASSPRARLGRVVAVIGGALGLCGFLLIAYRLS